MASVDFQPGTVALVDKDTSYAKKDEYIVASLIDTREAVHRATILVCQSKEDAEVIAADAALSPARVGRRAWRGSRRRPWARRQGV